MSGDATALTLRCETRAAEYCIQRLQKFAVSHRDLVSKFFDCVGGKNGLISQKLRTHVPEEGGLIVAIEPSHALLAFLASVDAGSTDMFFQHIENGGFDAS